MKQFFFILLVVSNFGLAQEPPPKAVFSLKPSLGMNGCQIHGDTYSGYNKIGLFAGTSVNAIINPKTSIELGFYFSQKGARKNENPRNGDYSSLLINLNYVDMPISVFYKVARHYFINGSISAAYLVNYSEIVNKVDYSGLFAFEKYEVGLNFGLGRVINEKFSVELRSFNSILPVRGYGLAATGVFYPNPIARFFNKGLYNNVLTIFITYHITSKKKSE